MPKKLLYFAVQPGLVLTMAGVSGRVVCRMGLSDHDPRPLSFQELGGGKKKVVQDRALKR